MAVILCPADEPCCCAVCVRCSMFAETCGVQKDTDVAMDIDRVFTLEYLVFPTFTIMEPNPMLCKWAVFVCCSTCVIASGAACLLTVSW